MIEPRSTADDAAIRETAARWIVRRDRGLSVAESIEFELWLAADPRHADAVQRSAGAWTLLDRVPEAAAQRHLAEAVRRRVGRQRVFAYGSLAAAAVVVLAAIVWWREPAPDAPAAATLVAAGPRAVTLGDGSLARLNAGGEIVEEFTATERRVRLVRGEAHFSVAKNPARPFVVSAGALRVRAVGTAFNVNLQSTQIEVLVTEGKVELRKIVGPARDERENRNGSPAGGSPTFLGANERAVLAVGATAPRAIVVTRVEPAGMALALAWQEPLLRLGGATLAEIAAEFERRSGRRVVLADPALAQLRVGGRFRADDVDGFANLLATTFDLEMERAVDGTLVLHKKNPVSR